MDTQPKLASSSYLVKSQLEFATSTLRPPHHPHDNCLSHGGFEIPAMKKMRLQCLTSTLLAGTLV
jgi:hypothetical protein